MSDDPPYACRTFIDGTKIWIAIDHLADDLMYPSCTRYTFGDGTKFWIKRGDSDPFYTCGTFSDGTKFWIKFNLENALDIINAMRNAGKSTPRSS